MYGIPSRLHSQWNSCMCAQCNL